MCGRFTLHTPREILTRRFQVDLDAPDLTARYNIAPTQPVLTVRQARDGQRRAEEMRWGLVPHWAKDPRIGARMINARSETAADKPAFRDALRHRRCLVPADGFYEWAPAGRGPKQPLHIARPDHGLFAFAGLFERWRALDESWLETCTLLTTDSNRRLASIHDRMPVILPPADWVLWLDPAVHDPERLQALLVPAPEGALEATAVGVRVNKPEHDDAECPAPPEQGSLF